MKKIILTAMIAAYGLIFSYGQESGKQWTNINYATDDKVYHNLDIYLPKTDKPVHKAIVIIYGSAWFGNNNKQQAYEALGKPLLSAGFAVITINHRASFDAAYPAQINDVKAAIRFIRANAGKYQIDTSFIGITGYSSGGHLSSLAGASNTVKKYTVGQKTVDIEGEVGNNASFSSTVDAVVDWFGPIDMTRMDAGCTKTKDDKSPEAALIHGNPADNLDMLALLNPVTYLSQKSPHFLVIHGDADNVVPYCQSDLFAKALKEKGLLDEFITVPNGQHGPVTFNESTFKKMVDFFLKESNKK
jgi:acetyl esterase/lipase